MRFGHYSLRARPFWAGAVLALIAAALLVAYLQRRHEAEQQAQRALIESQMAERTAALLADRLQQEFEAVVVNTIEGIDHADLRERRLAKIAPFLSAALERHRFVDRFLFWNQRLPASIVNEVAFFDPSLDVEAHAVPIRDETGEALGGLVADADLGAELLAFAHSPEQKGRTLILTERILDGERHEVVIHTYGASRWPEDAPGLIGFTVNLTAVEERLLPELVATEFARLVPADAGMPRLRFSLLNERGELAHGAPVAADAPSGQAPVDLVFFPRAEPMGWFAGRTIRQPQWTVVVTAEPDQHAITTQDFLYAALLGLILIALACAVLLNRQSLRLSKLHADFVANVTHQLKTPLSLLAAASETLEHERLRTPEKVREYAAIVGSQTASLTTLVERVLRLSRIDDATTQQDFEPLDLGRLVGDAVRRFDTTLANGNTALEFRAPDREVEVVGDPAALDDVMVNLLENAAKYSNGDGRVTVGVDRLGDTAVISVRDHGIGIDRGDLPHIFERFYRGRHNGSPVRGFGVGLSMVDSVVRAHHGRVVVESEPGRGSEFRVVLPTNPVS